MYFLQTLFQKEKRLLYGWLLYQQWVMIAIIYWSEVAFKQCNTGILDILEGDAGE